MQRLLAGAILLACCGMVAAQGPSVVKDARNGVAYSGGTDSDRDGLSDALEEMLLQRFAPEVMVSASDCSVLPAELMPNTSAPYVLADNGTVYGQASPFVRLTSTAKGLAARASTDGVQKVELHFYMLWRRDCGRMGHALDAEHVSALVEGDPADAESWRALYWYAAAHEDTVCDASQMTRASTISTPGNDAERHGARVWLSNGKHGSFLNKELCQHGCGGDRCVEMKHVSMPPVVNVGEVRAPMNGALWVGSPRWPLLEKMERTDFTVERLARLERLPETDVAWAEPTKRPAQAAIRGGNAGIDGVLAGGASTMSALGTSNHNTDTALVLANNRTGAALDVAAQSTGKAITRSATGVRDAMGNAWKHTGGALGTRKDAKEMDRVP